MEDLVAFTDRLASREPVPGGGGASALVGACASALGQMVCNLTVGKKRYAEHEDELRAILERLEGRRQTMLALIDEDAAAFEPLSRAYGIPKEDPSRAEVLEEALRAAARPPLAIMEEAATVIDDLVALSPICSRLVLSDVGVAAALAGAALEGASLNVSVNTRLMADRSYAAELDARAAELLERTCAARTVFEEIRAALSPAKE